MSNFMKGAKTYTGLVVSLLGLIGVAEFFSPTETAQIADLVIQFVGLVFAFYGRKVAVV